MNKVHLFLSAILIFQAQFILAQDVCGFSADNGDYDVVISITPTTLNKTCNGGGFTYTVDANYTVDVTGTPPANLYTLQGTITCGGTTSFFNLPNTGTGSTGTTTTANASTALNCGTTSLVDLNCSSTIISIQGPDLSPANGCPTVLPITLSYFQINKIQEGFEFSWETIAEINNENFVIEYSYDLEGYKKLTTIDGAGNSTEPITYDYFSTNSFLKMNKKFIYFRLKQVDFDGKYTYSNIITVSLEDIKFPVFDIYPNPATDELTIRSNDNEANINHEFYISNILTQELHQTINFTGPETTLTISNLASGVYIVSSKEKSTPQKLVVY